MEIRKIEIGDLDGVYKLLNDLYSNKLKYEIFAKIYKEKVFDNNSYYIVAVSNGKIVGVLTSEIQTKLHREKKQSFIEDLIVDKDYRNNGIGKELLQNAIEYAKKQDCEVIELTSYLQNDDAHRFYENNGFIKHSYKFKKYL
jgi:PhnO protein